MNQAVRVWIWDSRTQEQANDRPFRLVGNEMDGNTQRMNPIVLIVPVAILIGGVLCFVLLPVPLPIRLMVLISDVVAAGVIGFVLYRRLK